MRCERLNHEDSCFVLKLLVTGADVSLEGINSVSDLPGSRWGTTGVATTCKQNHESEA